MRLPVVLLLAGLLPVGFSACSTTTTTSVPTRDYLPRPVVELRRWEVWTEQGQVGWLVQLEIQDPQEPVRYYRIENLQKQWVGHASEQGRFSRREPFRDDERDLGLWPMRRGVAQLLEAAAPVELRTFVDERAAAAAAEAAATREVRK